MRSRSLALLLVVAGCGGSSVPAQDLPAPAPPAPSAAQASATFAKPTVKPPISPWSSLYPATRVADTKDVLFGTEIPDPYRWLEDAKSPDVSAWMASEDKLARDKLGALADRQSIAARLRDLVYVDRVNAPWKRGNRYFTSKRGAHQEKGIVVWREGKSGEDRILLDPNAWPEDAHLSLGHVSVSWDGKTVAYQTSKNHADEATMHVMDVATGKESAIDTIPGTQYGSASWTPKGDGFYYRFTPEAPDVPVADRSGLAELRFHKLGQDPRADRVVHEKTGDASVMLSGYVSRDGAFLFATLSRGWQSNDVLFQDLHKKPGVWVPFIVGKQAQYNVFSHRDRLYVVTNEGAPRWRIFAVDPAKPAREAWKEIVPERPDATLEDAEILGGKLALTYLKDVATKIEIHDLDGKLVREVALPGIGTAHISGDRDDDAAFIHFTSFTHPTEIFETSIKTGSSKTWFLLKVPADPSRFTVEQVSFTSKDGTRVPMFVVHAKDLKKDGSAPLYLTGYGGFQASMTPGFDASLFPWLERGGVFAIPNLRGGGEFGEEWHKAGMLEKKQNVFDDFIAAAEYLVHEGYTSASKLMAYGGSNGGLLMGAAITQRPDLFRVVLCDVPLLDMVRYHKFGLGNTWVPEYGSAEKEQDLRWLLAYSPYHHVTAGTKYPSVLMLSADSDDRVDPMHARKFAAALQARSSGGPVLLRIERNAGHGGADMLRAWVEKMADMYAFALAEIGETGAVMR